LIEYFFVILWQLPFFVAIFMKDNEMVMVNGKSSDIAAKTLAEYLVTMNYAVKHIVIEHHGEIIP